MEDAQRKINHTNVALQNAFFDADFRKIIYKWTNQPENQFALEPNILTYNSDPRWKSRLSLAGSTFIIGSLATASIASKGKTITAVAGKTVISWNPYIVAGAIAASVVTVLFSTIAFNIASEESSLKASEIIKHDIDQYLEASQKQILKWLEKVKLAFENYFHDFCLTNGIVLEDKPNE